MVVEGPERPPVRAGPAEDGAAAYTYNTSTPGAYTISASVRGAHVRGSPAAVVASIAEPHAPLCAIKGAPRELSVAAGTSARSSAFECACIPELQQGPGCLSIPVCVRTAGRW